MPKTLPALLQERVRETYRGLLAAANGTRRQSQLSMVGAIATAVANAKEIGKEGSGARMLAVDAPTGTGKTFAYGVGAVPVALAMGLKVIIATGKVSLQEQLVDRDLVDLAKVIPDMRVALVKGRSRYACPVRLGEAATNPTEEGAEARQLAQALMERRWDGDVDTLMQPPSKVLWAQATNDRKGCTGRRCRAFSQCPYYLKRAEVDAANVLVTNHDLLLSDVRAGFAVLPNPEDSVLIVDEAHGLPAKAVESLADSHTLDEAQQFVMRAASTVAAVRRVDRGNCRRLAEEVSDALSIMDGTLAEARMAVGRLDSATDARDAMRPVRFKGGRLPGWLGTVSGTVAEAAKAAAKALEELRGAIQDEEGNGLRDKDVETLLPLVGQACATVEQIAWVWELMAKAPAMDGTIAKWIELVDVAQGERDIRICVSPVAAGAYLHEALWSKVASTIHLSGTLTTVGGMAPYLRDSGLDHTPEVKTLSVASPFDYTTQAELIVPRDVESPKDEARHTLWLIGALPALVEGMRAGTGALVLFTSLKQLRAVQGNLPDWLTELVLSQADMSRREILERHEAAVKAGRKSVILGSASFEEGVDLKGDLCSLVVIAKLPFSAPNDPVSEELRDWLDSQGRSFFDEVAVPEACRRLAQGAGRLIRSETDRGVIVVADPRLLSTSYGRSMLASLQPYKLGRDLHA